VEVEERIPRQGYSGLYTGSEDSAIRHQGNFPLSAHYLDGRYRATICPNRRGQPLVVPLHTIAKGLFPGGKTISGYRVFVQLSPKHPESRVRAVIQNSGARIVLTSENHTPRLRGLVDHVMVINDSLFATDGKEHSRTSLHDDASLSVGSGHAACVIYTLRSTGTPKGVVLEHGALATGIKTLGETYGIKNDTRVFQFASSIFDMHLQDIFVNTMCRRLSLHRLGKSADGQLNPYNS
jgi:non-ribosomal peptide synthetase component F